MNTNYGIEDFNTKFGAWTWTKIARLTLNLFWTTLVHGYSSTHHAFIIFHNLPVSWPMANNHPLFFTWHSDDIQMTFYVHKSDKFLNMFEHHNLQLLFYTSSSAPGALVGCSFHQGGDSQVTAITTVRPTGWRIHVATTDEKWWVHVVLNEWIITPYYNVLQYYL